MMGIEVLIRIDENRVEVPVLYKEGMRTKGIIYVDRCTQAQGDSAIRYALTSLR
jgi:hypothetical protein